MTETKIYKVVITLEFPDGSIEYIIWEPELYGKLCYMQTDFQEMFYNKNNFKVQPIYVLFELWENPRVSTIASRVGDKIGMEQICAGSRVIPLKRI